MVTERKAQKFHGLEFRIMPQEEKQFYVTGDDPQFVMEIKNPSNVPRNGKIVYFWRLNGYGAQSYQNNRVLLFSVGANSERRYELQKEWFAVEGSGIWGINNFSEDPEKLADMEDNALVALAQTGRREDPLCTFSVRDKDVAKFNNRRFWITAVAAVIAAISSVIVLLLTIL